MENHKKLRKILKETGFNIIPPGEHRIDFVYKTVKSNYPELCDDDILSRDVIKEGSDQPAWKHYTRWALLDCRGTGTVVWVAYGVYAFGEEAHIAHITEESESDEEYIPKTEGDAREFIRRSIARRRGQGKFRREILKAYGGKCAVTGSSTRSVLDACHIRPYNGDDTDHVQNGILLRTDIHTLFDVKLLTIHEDYSIEVDDSIQDKYYREKIHGNQILLPKKKSEWPSVHSLRWRKENY